MSKANRIEFKHQFAVDPETLRQRHEVVVVRDGSVGATITDNDPLWRMLDLSAQEATWMLRNYRDIMRLKPEVKEILEAVIEYRHEQSA